MRIDIITVLPEMLEGFFNESILARAQKKGLAEIHLQHLRDYTLDKWKRVDDYPYGGVRPRWYGVPTYSPAFLRTGESASMMT